MDAVLVVAALLGLVAYAPAMREFERHHVRAAVVLAVVLVLFVLVLLDGGAQLGNVVGPRLRELESVSSP